MQTKLWEKFPFKGTILVAVPSTSCTGCFFHEPEGGCWKIWEEDRPCCSAEAREDGTDVIYERSR